MLQEVSQTIKNLLVEKGNLDPNEIDIEFDLPTREWQSKTSRPTINLYLYDIRESAQFRDPMPYQNRPGPNNTSIQSRTEGRFDLTFRLTAFAAEVEDEMRLLDRALLTLMQHQVIPDDVRVEYLKGESLPIMVGHPPSFVQSPADYWGAMDNEIRPSVDYRVTASLNLQQEIEVGLVTSAQFVVLEKNRLEPTEKVANSQNSVMIPAHIGGTVKHASASAEAEPERVEGATVTLVERGQDTTTDEEGRYVFRSIPPGDYTLRVKLPDDSELEQAISVPMGGYDLTVE